MSIGRQIELQERQSHRGVENPSPNVLNTSAEEVARNQATALLAASRFGTVGRASAVGTGLETANNLTADENFRWDSAEDAQLYDPAQRRRLIARMLQDQIRIVRYGLPNHLITRDSRGTWHGWDQVDAIVRDFHLAGIKVLLDMHHFGIEDRTRAVNAEGKTLHKVSYYLDPTWPDYYADFCAEAYRRYSSQISGVTLMNEPETTVGFQSGKWNGAFPGWHDPVQHFPVYIERSFQVATAVLKARYKIELFWRETPGVPRPLYVQSEAINFKADDPAFNEYVRYFVGDLIFGHEWVMSLNVHRLRSTPLELLRPTSVESAIDWVLTRYVFVSTPDEQKKMTVAQLNSTVAQQERARDRLADYFQEIQSRHARLKMFSTSDGSPLTMKTDMIYGTDYYIFNESSASGKPINPRPSLLNEQIQEGTVQGYRKVALPYLLRYRLPFAITETGSPFHKEMPIWVRHVLLESYLTAKETNLPLLGFVLYPAVDSSGWNNALEHGRERAETHPNGLYDQQTYAPKNWFPEFFDSFKTNDLE